MKRRTKKILALRSVVLLAAVVLLAGAAGCAKKTPPPVMPDTDRMEAEAHLRQGMTYVNMGDYSNAIVEFQKSNAKKPSAQAFSNLGAAYMQIGKPNLALTALKKAESMAPRDATVLYNLAAAQSVAGNMDLSLQYLDKALKQGFANYDAIRFDPDLENIRAEPDFRSILEKHKVFLQ